MFMFLLAFLWTISSSIFPKTLVQFLGTFCQTPCIPLTLDSSQSSIVCVCNSTYCDEFPSFPSNLTNNDVVVYMSSLVGKRFNQTQIKMAASSGRPIRKIVWLIRNLGVSNVTIIVDGSQRLQTILGFGGAFTDATGLNVMNLSDLARRNWVESYFGPQGKS